MQISIEPILLSLHFSKVCYHPQFQDPALSGASVATTSKVHASVILVNIVGHEPWVSCEMVASRQRREHGS
jgi:hypothetical protein